MRAPWLRPGWPARVVVALAPVVFLWSAALAGASVGWSWYAVGLAAAVLPAYADTDGPLLVWAVLGVLWVVGTSGFSWWVLPAAVAALSAHSATAYLAAAPPNLRVPPGLRRLWIGRFGVVVLLTCATAVATQVVGAMMPVGSTALTVLVLLALAAGLYAVRPRRVSSE
ncbi:MAG: hypothetical protein V9G08_12505 [Dermatophilaceae bacterium]